MFNGLWIHESPAKEGTELTIQYSTKNQIELTGDPFVDNGLAIIAAIGDALQSIL